MNGYTLIERMRKARRRERFTAIEQALYYELVALCNEDEWGEIFFCSNAELCLSLGNIDVKTLQRARDHLINAGLIFYQKGTNKKEIGKYSFSEDFSTMGINPIVPPIVPPIVSPIVPPIVPPIVSPIVPPTELSIANINNVVIDKTKTKLDKEKEIYKEKENEKNKEPPDWRKSFDVYLANLRDAYRLAMDDLDFVADLEKYNPGVDVRLSLEKACSWYWSTEAGWKKKKAGKTDVIDWRKTFRNALSLNSNKIWLQKNSYGTKNEETRKTLQQL